MDLVRTLFDHVTSVLLDAGLSVAVLAPHPIDPPAGAQVMRDREPGLNRAVHGAVRELGVPVLVVHADLPRLSVSDVDRVLGTRADVVVARAHDGGTNGLLLRKWMPPAFGRGSALAHASRARSLGLTASVLDVPGFAIDVDDDATLGAYHAFARRTRP